MAGLSNSRPTQAQTKYIITWNREWGFLSRDDFFWHMTDGGTLSENELPVYEQSARIMAHERNKNTVGCRKGEQACIFTEFAAEQE